MSTSARTIDGDLQLPRVVVTDFAQVVRQKVIDTLNLWQGEWFLDQLAGFPWAQNVFGDKLVNTVQIEALLRQTLLDIDGIASVIASSLFDRPNRQFAYSFTAFLTNGQQLNGGSNTPFTITGSP